MLKDDDCYDGCYSDDRRIRKTDNDDDVCIYFRHKNVFFLSLY